MNTGSRGTVALAAMSLTATGLVTGVAAPSDGATPDHRVQKVYVTKGWSEFGRTDVTVTETINPDGTGFAEAGGGVATVSESVASRAAAAGGRGAEVTWSDLVAYVNTPLGPDEVDEGPQPDSDGVVTYRSLDRTPGSGAPGSDVMTDDPMSTNGGLPTYDCTGVQSFSDNDVHFKVCTQYILKTKQNGHTYFGTKGVGSAWSTDTNCINCDRITQFAAENDLTNNVGTVFSWAPQTTGSIGSCGSRTASTSATIGGTTISSSDTETVCPSKFGAYGPYITNSSSGSYWSKGDAAMVPKNETRGAHFVQLCDWDRGKGTLYLASHGTVWWN